MIVDPALVSGAACYKLLIGAVVPRPIAFVSSVSADGVRNLAPFSFFNAICGEPPVICFSVSNREPRKDTLANVRATGEFVVNIVSEEIAAQMNLASGEYPAEVDEFDVSGLTAVASDLVKVPRVKESHVNMECRLMQVVEVSTRPRGGSLGDRAQGAGIRRAAGRGRGGDEAPHAQPRPPPADLDAQARRRRGDRRDGSRAGADGVSVGSHGG